jgi:hypothetical protein
VAYAEARRQSGRWAGHAGLWSRFLDWPPGPVVTAGGVEDEAAVDDVAAPPLEGHGVLLGVCVAFGELVVIQNPGRDDDDAGVE